MQLTFVDHVESVVVFLAQEQNIIGSSHQKSFTCNI